VHVDIEPILITNRFGGFFMLMENSMEKHGQAIYYSGIGATFFNMLVSYQAEIQVSISIILCVCVVTKTIYDMKQK